MSGFFAVEDDLTGRIRAAVPGVKVEAVRDTELLDTLLKSGAGVAVGVLYRGYAPVADSGWGAYIVMRQTWWAVVVVSASSQDDAGASLRAKADEALTAIIKAVPGAEPELGNAFQYHLAPAPDMATKPGWAYVPLAFSVDINFSSGPRP